MQALPQQRLAIEAPLGPVLVVAGPGAGKTYCLIARIQHLVDRGFDPHRICAVTSTNRAAGEIATRLQHTLGAQAEAVTRGTIHAFCLALLREHAEAAGLRRGFGVADDAYQRVILSRLRVPPDRRGQLLNLFGRHRFQSYRLTANDARLCSEYSSWLAHRNMVDFDDLIVKAEPLAHRIADRWDYVLIDEFQDVNDVQYELLKRLAAPHGNIFAVGDDEQSIFTWTGANPYVLVRFRRDYDIAEPIILDKNCRCSRQIFETARRVLAQNPQLFQKELSADRDSPHEVAAFTFRDEQEEATWLVEHLGAERDAAILYRKHRVGEYLEGRLLRAGIPCRLARGRSLMEDDVIRYVVTALRVVRFPADPVALEAFARCVLSEHFLQEVEAALDQSTEDFLSSVRTLARRRPAQDPDTKKLWRLVYQVENLRALPRSHGTLQAVVDELLSQSIGPYRNALEERHDELTDPAQMPEAVRLAEQLEQAMANGDSIAIEPRGGIEIALRGMLAAAGLRKLPSSATHDAPRTTHVSADGLTLFKSLQLVHARELDARLPSYVTFDFETTDTDVATCGGVEIGAARVVNGEIVDRFHALVNPYRPISARGTESPGYTDADVATAPPFTDVFQQFQAFVGSDILVAHNGQKFDIPVLRRLASGCDGVDALVFYDTLPLVRSLSHDSGKLEAGARRAGLSCGRAHHALDDACTLALVYRELEKQRVVRARKAVLNNVLDYLGLAIALEQGAGSMEQKTLFDIARLRTLGPYSDALEFYAMERERTGSAAPDLEEGIHELGGRKLMARLRERRDPAERYASAVARLGALTEEADGTLNGSIDRRLVRAARFPAEGARLARCVDARKCVAESRALGGKVDSLGREFHDRRCDERDEDDEH